MDAGSRQEDASNQEGGAPFRFIATENAAGRYARQALSARHTVDRVIAGRRRHAVAANPQLIFQPCLVRLIGGLLLRPRFAGLRSGIWRRSNVAERSDDNFSPWTGFLFLRLIFRNLSHVRRGSAETVPGDRSSRSRHRRVAAISRDAATAKRDRAEKKDNTF
jgi:hypothetical protein